MRKAAGEKIKSIHVSKEIDEAAIGRANAHAYVLNGSSGAGAAQAVVAKTKDGYHVQH